MQHDMLVYLEKWSLKSLDVGYGNKLFFLFWKECDLYVDINMRIKLIFLYHIMDLMSFLASICHCIYNFPNLAC